jgi:hypothetical protein
MLSAGSVEYGAVGTNDISTFFPKYFICEVPYVFSSQDDFWKFWNGPGKELSAGSAIEIEPYAVDSACFKFSADICRDRRGQGSEEAGCRPSSQGYLRKDTAAARRLFCICGQSVLTMPRGH